MADQIIFECFKENSFAYKSVNDSATSHTFWAFI